MLPPPAATARSWLHVADQIWVLFGEEYRKESSIQALRGGRANTSHVGVFRGEGVGTTDAIIGKERSVSRYSSVYMP